MKQKTFWISIFKEDINKKNILTSGTYSNKEDAIRELQSNEYLLEVQVKKIYEKGGLKEVKI